MYRSRNVEPQPLSPRPAPVAAARAIARRLLGDDFARVQVGLTELQQRRTWRRSPVRPVTERWLAARGLGVVGGPFTGLDYEPSAVGFADCVVAKLVGAYERELHPVVRELQGSGEIDSVVNIGCAEGYYAVGLARTMPRVHVHAYDLNPTMRRLCRRMAERNGVLERISVHGRCGLEELDGAAGERTLVLADCEGAELELLDPRHAPSLRESLVVVELHDYLNPAISSTVLGRFEATHDSELISSEPRYATEHPEPGEVPGISPVEHEIALLEFRPAPMQWAVLRPRGA